MVKQETFQLRGGDLESADFEDLFETVNDEEISVFVDYDFVTCMDPAIDKGLFGTVNSTL